MVNRIIAVALVALGSIVQQSEPRGPVVFGPGVLSSSEVFRGTFAADGNTFYFFKKTGSGEDYRIFSSRRNGASWTTPAVLDLGGTFSDLYPAISRDGRRLVFSSYRPTPGAASGAKPNAHLWYAERNDIGWSTPVFMARASTFGHYHSWVEFGFDNAVYFRRTTPDWKLNETMRVRWTGTEYSSPEPYVDAERWKGWRADVNVVGGSPGPDGRSVFLDVATKHPKTGRGASDIWVTIKRGDTWSEPVPLRGGVNSDGFDVFPFVSPDGRDLYFVRDFATFHRLPLTDALPAPQSIPEVRYIANSGMLVSTGGRRFLIDAPIREGIVPYATSSADERERLEGSLAPYDNIDAILVTHWHEDHFSADAVARHLARSPRTLFISSPEVVDRLRQAAPALPTSQLRAIAPPPGSVEQVDVGGVPVRVLRIRHNPTRRLPEQHVGFLIGTGPTVLHVGDADPAADNFALLRGLPNVDLALLPFWYVFDEKNRRFVADSIRPARVIAMHVPPGDAEKIAATLRAANVTAQVAAVPGTSILLSR